MIQNIPNYYSFNTLYASSLNTSINDILLFKSNANQLTIQQGLIPSVAGVNINVTPGVGQGLNVTLPFLNNNASQTIVTTMNLVTGDTLAVATVNNTSGFLVVNLTISSTTAGQATYTLTPALALVPSLTNSFPTGSLIGQICLCAYTNTAGTVTLDLSYSVPRIVYNVNNGLVSNSYNGTQLITTVNGVASGAVAIDGATMLGYDPANSIATNTVPVNTAMTNLWTSIEEISNLQGFQAFAAQATTNINLANPGTAVFDGITLSNGDYLFLDTGTQTSNSGADCGGWVFHGSSSALTRVPTMNTWDDIRSTNIFISAGTTYANTRYFNGNAAGGTLGTTPITYFMWNTAYTAGTNMVLAGNVFSTSLTPAFTSLTLGTALSIANGGSGAATQPAAYYNLSNSAIVPSGIMDTTDKITITRGSTPYTGELSLLPYQYPDAGSVLRTTASKLSETVSVSDFGAVCDGITDDTAAIQLAVDYAFANEKDLLIDGMCFITASINLDNNPGGGHWLTITSLSGGGIKVTDNIAIFSSSYPFTTDPVTGLINFVNLKFQGVYLDDMYVLDDGRFVRTNFIDCSFVEIKLLSSSIYVQMIKIFNCDIRTWQGEWFNAPEYALGCAVSGSTAESGETFIYWKRANGCAITDNVIEGMTIGTAIRYIGGGGLTISGNYFEDNLYDIDGRENSIPAYGVAITGNYFDHDHNSNYTMYWGLAEGCISMGNYTNGNGHFFSTSEVATFDKIVGTYSNISGQGNTVPSINTAKTNLPLTMTDGSGAGLALTFDIHEYSRIGNLVNFSIKVTYPATGSGSQAVLTGLPVAAHSLQIVTAWSIGVAVPIYAFVNGVALEFYEAASTLTNAEASTKTIYVSGTYAC